MQFTVSLFATLAAFASAAFATPWVPVRENEDANSNVNVNQIDNANDQFQFNEHTNVQHRMEELFRDFCGVDSAGNLHYLGKRSLAKRGFEDFGLLGFENFDFNNNQNANVNQLANQNNDIMQTFNRNGEPFNAGDFISGLGGVRGLVDCFVLDGVLVAGRR